MEPPPPLSSLPPPPPGKTGWPWTVDVPPPAVEPGTEGGWPLVTIVTPSYQHGRYLEETIRSILLQGYPRLEYIVIDGGSRDETVSILEKYSPWIAHWESVKDRGQCDAINKGFARANGTILNWVNSDDLLLPGALFKLLGNPGARAALTGGRPGMVVGAGYMCDEELRPAHYFLRFYFHGPAALARGIRFDNPTLQPAIFFNRRFWEETAPFDLELHYTFDWELWIRGCARGAALECLPEFLAAAHLHGEQKTETGGEARLAEMERMLLRNAGDDSEYAALVRTVARVRRALARFSRPGGPVRHYAGWWVPAVLRLRFRGFTRGQIRDALVILGL